MRPPIPLDAFSLGAIFRSIFRKALAEGERLCFQFPFHTQRFSERFHEGLSLRPLDKSFCSFS
jgi:hypothetical protein